MAGVSASSVFAPTFVTSVPGAQSGSFRASGSGWRERFSCRSTFDSRTRGSTVFIRPSCPVGGGALARWPSVRRSNCTDGFPVCSFHEDTGLRDAPKGQQLSGPSFTRPVGAGLQYPRTMMYGFCAKRTDPPHHPYSADYPSLPSCLRLPPSPTHSGRRSLGHAAFAAL